jgi:hypothetical protein
MITIEFESRHGSRVRIDMEAGVSPEDYANLVNRFWTGYEAGPETN